MELANTKRALVFAFKKEAESFIEKFKQAQKTKLNDYTVYYGEYLGIHTALIITGCGISACRQATEQLKIQCTELTEVFNIGFSGSISDFYDCEDVVQVGQVFTEKGELFPIKLMLHNTLPIAKCISKERPVETVESKKQINDRCEVDIVDMEAIGFCRALEGFSGKVSIFKIISDFADQDFKSEVIKNSRLLSDKLEKKFKLAIEV